MKPKREKREKWVKHSVHCRCDVALEEALSALAELERHYCLRVPSVMATDGVYAPALRARAVLAKYGKSPKKGGQKPDAGAARNGPAASAEITEQQQRAHLNFQSGGGYEG